MSLKQMDQENGSEGEVSDSPRVEHCLNDELKSLIKLHEQTKAEIANDFAHLKFKVIED